MAYSLLLILFLHLCFAKYYIPPKNTYPFFNHTHHTADTRVKFNIGQQSDRKCAQSQICVAFSKCQFRFSGGTLNRAASCKLDDRSSGVCCDKSETESNTNIRFLEGPELSYIYKVDSVKFEEKAKQAADDAVKFLDNLDNFSESLTRSNIFVKPFSADAAHLSLFRTPSINTQETGKQALKQIEIAKRLFYSHDSLLDYLSIIRKEQDADFSLNRTFSNSLQIFFQDDHLGDNKSRPLISCPAPPICDSTAIYRTIDGSCNNLRVTDWGRSVSPLHRLLSAVYSDGVHEPRKSFSARELPSARLISRSVFNDHKIQYVDINLGVMTWGQFLDHDLSLTPIFQLDEHKGIECCTKYGEHLPQSLTHPQCFPIEIPPGDQFYHSRKSCMNFVRSLPVYRHGCTLGAASQMNAITHFMDASNIYGSDMQSASTLRRFLDGELREHGTRAILPYDTSNTSECFDSRHCYLAGDVRVNENPLLTLLHTSWLREHNRIARYLRCHSGSHSDEVLYQVARIITIAEWQHITYNEWLPIVIGNQYMKIYNLDVSESTTEYDPTINPSISNEFSTAAFRFGHSLVQDLIKLYDKEHNSGSEDYLKLRKSFQNPKIMQDDRGMMALLRSLYSQSMQQLDLNIVDDMRHRLFEQNSTLRDGMDIISLNIQRGRDHGLPTYNQMRVRSGLQPVKHFRDLVSEIPEQTVNVLCSIYEHVDDIDLFVGALSERALAGSLLGPTLAYLLSEQFSRLRRGDRFFYDVQSQPHSLTSAQIREIKNANWARILCDNYAEITHIQPLAFYAVKSFNKLQSCESTSIPRVNLKPFLELVK